MYFSAENLLEVNTVMMNELIRIAFSIIICGGRKTEECGLDMRGYMQV